MARIVYVLAEDGTEYYDPRFFGEVKGGIKAYGPDDEFGFQLYRGYTRPLLEKMYPGAPIRVRFSPRKDWGIFEPQTYKLALNAGAKPLRLVGTYTGDYYTAFHVGATSAFEKNGVMEVPNSPNSISTFLVSNVAQTSLTTSPAVYRAAMPPRCLMKLEADVCRLEVKKPEYFTNEVLFFKDGVPVFVNAAIYGLVSGSIRVEDKQFTIVTPFVDTPHSEMYFTGARSGTVKLRFVKSARHAFMRLNGFGSLLVEKVWIFEGTSGPGDSGAPVFVL